MKLKLNFIFVLLLAAGFATQSVAQNTLYSSNISTEKELRDWTLSEAKWDSMNNGQLVFAKEGAYAILPVLQSGSTNMWVSISAIYGNYLYLHTSPDGKTYTDQGLFAGKNSLESASKHIPDGTRYVKFVAAQGTRNDVTITTVKIEICKELYSSKISTATNVNNWTLSEVSWDSKNEGQIVFKQEGAYAILPILPADATNIKIEISAIYGNYLFLHTSSNGKSYTDHGRLEGSKELETSFRTIPDGTRYIKFVAASGTRNDVFITAVAVISCAESGTNKDKYYTLTLKTNDPALGKVKISENDKSLYKAGEKITLEAIPVDLAIFTHWKEDNVVREWAQKHSYTMPAQNVEITGNFAPSIPPTSTTLTISPGTPPPPPTTTTISPGTPPPPGEDTTLQIQFQIQLMLTGNLGCAELTGEGLYYMEDIAKVSAKAPAAYKFKGWYLCDELISDKENFNYKITEKSNICLHAEYYNVSNPPCPPKLLLFEGKYVSPSFYFYDDIIPYNPGMKIDSIMATGFIEYRPATKDLWSPYSENNLGVLKFYLGEKRYEVFNEFKTGYMKSLYQQACYLAMTIYEITDEEIIVSAGGYIFGAELLDKNIWEKLSAIRRIPYKLNSDGSITLKKFNITGKANQLIRDITFYPKPNMEIKDVDELWYEDKIRVYKGGKFFFKDYESQKIAGWYIIRESVIPMVLDKLKNKSY